MEKEKLVSLVRRAQTGETEAMDALFAEYYNDVYYFALKTVKDSDVACDVTQETFLDIIRNIDKLNEPAAFVVWMKQIAYHQCTRYFNKKKEVLVEEDEDGNTIFDILPDESEGSIPSEIVEQEEFRQTILAMIDQLTEEQRSAVMLYYFDELTVGQIAQIQGVSEGTVKSRLNYARKAIKKSVESYEKKHNVKLHSFALLPLLLLLFGRECMPEAQALTVRATVNAAAKAGAAGAGSVAVSTAGATATGGFMSSLGAKILVGVVVGTLGLGLAAVAGIAGAVGIGALAANILISAQRVDTPQGMPQEATRETLQLEVTSGLKSVATSDLFSIVIQEDGTVFTDLKESEYFEHNGEMREAVDGWIDLISVDASLLKSYSMDDQAHIVGLKRDGTVVATGDNSHGECEVQGWMDIAAVFAGADYTVGLQKDGTLVYTEAAYWVEDYLQVNESKNIATICCSRETIGVLHKDGTVWFSDQAMNEALSATDVVQLCVNENSAFLLKADGTVQSYGCGRGERSCECEYWTDVVQIASSFQMHLGLKADGTVCACGIGYEGENYEPYCIQDWTDIAYIWARGLEPYGIRKDGAVVEQYDTDDWVNVRISDPNIRD